MTNATFASYVWQRVSRGRRSLPSRGTRGTTLPAAQDLLLVYPATSGVCVCAREGMCVCARGVDGRLNVSLGRGSGACVCVGVCVFFMVFVWLYAIVCVRMLCGHIFVCFGFITFLCLSILCSSALCNYVLR